MKRDDAVELALQMANDPVHGYDQTHRWGPDYDCSSFLSYVWQEIGVPVRDKGATYTGNMYPAFTAAGFRNVTGSINLKTGAGLQSGDVLLNVKNHTAMYIGSGRVVQASGNEKGGITGGQTGDQTGREIATGNYYNFPWDYVLRYEEMTSTEPTGTYTVQYGDTLWGIADRFLGDGALYGELMEANGLKHDLLTIGMILKIPGEKETATVDAAWISVQLPVLKRGDVGQSVAALQTLLTANAIALKEYGTDGEFGPETEAGVLLYQKQQGLVENGTADKSVWKTLLGGK